MYQQPPLPRERFGVNTVHVRCNYQGYGMYTVIVQSIRDCDEGFVVEFTCDRLDVDEAIQSVLETMEVVLR